MSGAGRFWGGGERIFIFQKMAQNFAMFISKNLHFLLGSVQIARQV